MNESIVKVENLSHKYSVQWAIKDINFELTKNGIYGLLGANGAGKSTTMNIMCGVLKQTHGEVYIKGISLAKHPIEAKKHIGFLPQHPPLISELTVEEYLVYCANLRLIPSAKISKAVDEVLIKCSLDHFRKRLISNLSGGYQQRVGIAQAIIHKPDFVVLDEPTNGLDPNQIQEIRNLIREIAEERTVVLSTHILQEVQALCEHIWMINDGAVTFSGPIQEFDNYIKPSTLIVHLLNSPGVDELRKLEGVLELQELGSNRYRLHYAHSQKLTDLLVSTSVNRDWKLQEISLEKNSLETVFAELSRKKKV